MDKGATKEPVTSTPALLVAIGVKADGHKVVLAVSSGYRESTASWSAPLRDLKARRMNAPRLPAVAAGQQYHDGLPIRAGRQQEAAA